jgi:uncharacterized membrane protein YadS
MNDIAPGLLLSLAVASVATVLGQLVPVVGSPVFGIAGGAILAAFIRPGDRLRPGLAVAGTRVLQAAPACRSPVSPMSARHRCRSCSARSQWR